MYIIIYIYIIGTYTYHLKLRYYEHFNSYQNISGFSFLSQLDVSVSG